MQGCSMPWPRPHWAQHVGTFLPGTHAQSEAKCTAPSRRGRLQNPPQQHPLAQGATPAAGLAPHRNPQEKGAESPLQHSVPARSASPQCLRCPHVPSCCQPARKPQPMAMPMASRASSGVCLHMDPGAEHQAKAHPAVPPLLVAEPG